MFFRLPFDILDYEDYSFSNITDEEFSFVGRCGLGILYDVRCFMIGEEIIFSLEQWTKIWIPMYAQRIRRFNM